MIEHDLSDLLLRINFDNLDAQHRLDERLKSEAIEWGVHVPVDQHLLHNMGVKQACNPLSPHSSTRSDSISTTFSFRHYDHFLSHGVPNGRHSIAFTPKTSPSQSVFSLPLSQPSSPDKKHFRRIRGFSLLRPYRPDCFTKFVQACPHCPRDVYSQRRAIHKLSCGHRLCTQALRNTIKVAIESETGAVPSCCGKPIPGSLVEKVMAPEEQHALLQKLEMWDGAVSIVESVSSSRRDSVAQPRSSLTMQSQPGRPSSETPSPEARKTLEMIMEREDYRLLRVGQAAQRDCFLAWVENERDAVNRKHEAAWEEMRQNHEHAVEELQDRHASAVAEAEDKQVKAEADLRDAHAHETRDTATALKHMEAYCAGTLRDGTPHHRTVTAQEILELDKTRRFRDQMDMRHASAINVLRGEQARRMRLRHQRQDRELHDLQRYHHAASRERQRACHGELVLLDETVAEKRRKLQWRWELQSGIFVKKIQAELGLPSDSPPRLPPVEWGWSSPSPPPAMRCDSITAPPDADDRDVGEVDGVRVCDADAKMEGRAGIMHVQEFKIGA